MSLFPRRYTAAREKRMEYKVHTAPLMTAFIGVP